MSEVEKLVERLRNDFAPYWDREAKTCLTPEVARAYYERADQAREAASALQSQARRVEELEETETRWLIRFAAIREASGLGAKPMLGELADAIRARIEELEGALRKIANANISEYAAQIARSALSEGSGSSRELAPPDESGDACGATERAEG